MKPLSVTPDPLRVHQQEEAKEEQEAGGGGLCRAVVLPDKKQKVGEQMRTMRRNLQ